MKFVNHDVDNVRMKIMELDNHPYYVADQYNPEYIFRPLAPSPPYFGLILASVGKLISKLLIGLLLLSSFLSHGCRNYVSGRSTSGSSDPGQNRKDFLHYTLSLMRSHNGEHSDSLPILVFPS